MIPLMSTGLCDDFIKEEILLPEQFIPVWTRPLTPERRLAFAVLWTAVFDLQKYRFATRRRHQRRYMEAYLWVDCDDLEWEFSFRRLCEAFQLEADEARAALLDIARVAPDTHTAMSKPGRVAAAATAEDIDQAA